MFCRKVDLSEESDETVGPGLGTAAKEVIIHGSIYRERAVRDRRKKSEAPPLPAG